VKLEQVFGSIKAPHVSVEGILVMFGIDTPMFFIFANVDISSIIL